VLRLQNERSRRAQEIVTEQAQREQLRFQLNRLLNRDLYAPWPVLALPEVAPEVVYSDRLRRLTLNYEARLRTMRAEVGESRAAVAQTRRQRWPDLFVGLEGRQYSGSGDFREGMLTVGMNLPWLNRSRYRADQRREEARLRAAELSLADYELFVPAEAHRVTILADAARREALLYRDEIIPRSQTALSSAEGAWRANQGSFLDVLETRRMLNESRLIYLRAVSEQYFMLLELALCCGVADLEALEMLGQPQPNPGAPEASPNPINGKN
jgi:outer membrane protein, heavy metal efflux system